MSLLLAALLSTPPAQHLHQQHVCMANAVWHEARGEPLKGRRAVVDVVLNRVKAEKAGICSVVFRRGQFTWAKPLWGKAPRMSSKPPHFIGFSHEPGEQQVLPPQFMRLTLPKAMLYTTTLLHKPVLTDSSYVFFSRGYQYGSGCVRIGEHLFCKGEL